MEFCFVFCHALLITLAIMFRMMLYTIIMFKKSINTPYKIRFEFQESLRDLVGHFWTASYTTGALKGH